ncbi:BREX-2 system adenine-specific DNA-methyltransferase PglX [Planomonospora corallina]|uniref:site-specific DNA-methyltransferase (adenine-specific) n=1 Tax=Planomonospora corallina TaxID=1806052 RepID=A0ABV8IC34_9ACTN
MIDRTALLADLRRQTAELKAHLLDSWTAEPPGEPARGARRSATPSSEREERADRTATAWVLGTVLLRFCEDNGLIEPVFVTGPGERSEQAIHRQGEYFRDRPRDNDRDRLRTAFAEVTAALAPVRIFPDQEEPIPHEAAGSLLAFWRRRDENGELIHDFTDPEWSTDFLGDLYQDLSETARKTYALVRTPAFVSEFILDRTLGPALEEFGPDGFRMIDPVCGSGGFLLGAFHRLLSEWQRAAPGMDRWEAVRRSAASVHGVDLNPNAVTIARFRLLVAAMKAGEVRRLTGLPPLVLPVAVGDSLLDGRHGPGRPAVLRRDESADPRSPSDGDVRRYSPSGTDLLAAGSYHAVVGNPPYLTVRDKRMNEAYRDAYADVCSGKYTLTVPFAQRFFQLARPANPSGEGAGHVGQLTANSFMKREFGRSLIENFLSEIDLTQVVDTSGAYIPGHGTPTVILFGRNRPARSTPVTAVVGLRGEPDLPADPARGRVWQSILAQSSGMVREDEWTQTLLLDRAALRSFPWNLTDSTTTAILRSMGDGNRLGARVARIGYVATTGADDVFIAPPASFRRMSLEKEEPVRVITGSEVRDWTVTPVMEAFRPEEIRVGLPRVPREQLERLWPYRTVLGHRANHSGGSYFQAGRAWYGWHHVTGTRGAHDWSIVFPWVATHPHFSVLRTSDVVPLHSAPVIKLPKPAWEVDHKQLAALLNSSAVCFWLKQHSQRKGQSGPDQLGSSEPWTDFYEFTSTRLADLPLPPDRWSGDRWSRHATTLDDHAQALAAAVPAEVLRSSLPPSREALEEARARWTRLREKMIALQEELDWEIYGRYGLLPDSQDLLADSEGADVPRVRPGERAFEIVLARRLSSGTIETDWFERHGLAPVTTVPEDWPHAYRNVVLRRIDAIERNAVLGVLERPEFKRRWASEGWDRLLSDALRTWLLDRCESSELWYGLRDGWRHPRPLTVAELAGLLRQDDEFVRAADFYAPRRTVEQVLRDLLADQHVPYLAALRLRESGLRKRAAWEEVWDLQRQEDELRRRSGDRAADRLRDTIPVPPRYTAADFLKTGYWSHRGKLDVPKERFISYPGVARGGDLLIGWSGWNLRDRARVLLDLAEAQERENPSAETVIPLAAGLLELEPWLIHPDGGYHYRPTVEAVRACLDRVRTRHALSEEALRAWRPPKPSRGRPRKNL